MEEQQEEKQVITTTEPLENLITPERRQELKNKLDNMKNTLNLIEKKLPQKNEKAAKNELTIEQIRFKMELIERIGRELRQNMTITQENDVKFRAETLKLLSKIHAIYDQIIDAVSSSQE